MWFKLFDMGQKGSQILFGDEVVLSGGTFVNHFVHFMDFGMFRFGDNVPFSFSKKIYMQVFRNGNEPRTKTIVGIICGNLIKSFGKSLDGNVFSVIFIFGTAHLKTVNIVPKVIQ